MRSGAITLASAYIPSTINRTSNRPIGRQHSLKEAKMEAKMLARFSSRTRLAATLAASALLGAGLLATSGTALAAPPCQGSGAPTNTETKCLTAVQIPGAALRSYDISWVNPHRAEYYLGD